MISMTVRPKAVAKILESTKIRTATEVTLHQFHISSCSIFCFQPFFFSFTVFIEEIVNRTSRTSHGKSRNTTARENCKWRI